MFIRYRRYFTLYPLISNAAPKPFTILQSNLEYIHLLHSYPSSQKILSLVYKAFSLNGMRVCEALSVAKGLGERKRTAYLLLSECVSTEASISERRVSRSAIYITLLNSKETEYKNTFTFCSIFRAYSNLSSFSLDMIIPLTLYWS